MLAERPKFLALRVSLQRLSGLPLWLLFIFMGRGSSQIEDHQPSCGIGARALSRVFSWINLSQATALSQRRIGGKKETSDVSCKEDPSSGRRFGAPFAGSACRHGETCDNHDFIQLWDGSHCSATIPLGTWTMGKIIDLSPTVPRQYAKPEVKPLLNFTDMRWYLDEHVDMLLGQNARDDLYPQFLADLPNDGSYPLVQCSFQNLIAIFGNPDDVVAMVV